MRRSLVSSLLVFWVACSGQMSGPDRNTGHATEEDGMSGGDGDMAAEDEGDSEGDSDGVPGESDAGAMDDAGVLHEGFVHPGVIVNRGMLDFVKAKIESGAQPWKDALESAKNSRFGSLDYQAHPRENVECGPYSMPDNGCTDEKADAAAAFTHALLWYHTRDEAHAEKALEIMNAWSALLKQHTLDNAPLQSAWVSEVFPRAAELMKHTYDGWDGDNQQRFADMLRNVYLPLMIDGSDRNGNWDLSMIDAVINIGVFLDDKDVFDKGVKMWRERVPAYAYLASDGPTPVEPPRGSKTGEALIEFWYGQRTFVDGLCQETCRDLGHVQYGLAAMINAAETARIQGVDLYGEQADRIVATLDFHAKFINGEDVPGWLCNGSLTDVRADPMWEIGFNHYAARLGRDLPATGELARSIRPSGADHHMVFETLTHADIGNAGL
jgi:hypothetical protein